MFLRWPSLRLADWRVSEINNGQLTIGQGCHVESSLLKESRILVGAGETSSVVQLLAGCC